MPKRVTTRCRNECFVFLLLRFDFPINCFWWLKFLCDFDWNDRISIAILPFARPPLDYRFGTKYGEKSFEYTLNFLFPFLLFALHILFCPIKWMWCDVNNSHSVFKYFNLAIKKWEILILSALLKSQLAKTKNYFPRIDIKTWRVEIVSVNISMPVRDAPRALTHTVCAASLRMPHHAVFILNIIFYSCTSKNMRHKFTEW